MPDADPAAMQRFFDTVGYWKVPGAISSDMVSAANDALDREFREPDERFKTIRNADGVPVQFYQIMQRPHTRQIMQHIIGSASVVSPLIDLLGPNITVALNRHNQATFNYSGDIVPRFHRDTLSRIRNVVSAVFYFEDATPETGCTWVVPSSHLEKRVGVPQPTGGGTWMDEHQEFKHLHEQAIPIPCKAGDMLLFDGLMFHSVGDNKSPGSRKSAVFGFRPFDELGIINPKLERPVCGSPIYRGNDLDWRIKDPAVIHAIQQGIPLGETHRTVGLSHLLDVTIDPAVDLFHEEPNFHITDDNCHALETVLRAILRQEGIKGAYATARGYKRIARNLLQELDAYNQQYRQELEELYGYEFEK